MDVNDLHPPDDYSHRFFIWHEWIQANGPLTSENVFDYFATSMFYDKQSNNQVLRMQTIHTGMPIVNEAEELRRFVGIEFAVVHAEPPSFFVIQKRERLSPDEVRPLAAYFVTNNRIYQSPDLYTVLSNRLLTSVSALQSSLDILRKHRPDYTPRSGFVWPIVDSSTAEDGAKKRDAETGDASSVISQARPTEEPKKQQNNMLLVNAMRATALHSKMSFTTTSAAHVENATTETPVAAPMRSSATPAPAPQDTSTKGDSTAAIQDATRAPPGAGKKKKKRSWINT
ncbi:uncharacterized protein LACBIDRAFT_301761 [Laccaria bicolor S238N-H82]|uniref:Mediator of RNA polymerase II transcription subunit 6 n=1 Tax=Laccaria bicolor (strain S238N-H82 / ATCC MYA-4686) TaxID=486041 RepID=B0CP82_LACBS|nr:uncharacterized protein LACBIDRAFT_301761 [Laccaria bicolor S238N-H82]EDR16056.1 predicted protein [Laccaria bicolor S238N-H82]|eukprot:XP_001874264.1 predicted protein [Laccaria bicolor S238N-H82]